MHSEERLREMKQRFLQLRVGDHRCREGMTRYVPRRYNFDDAPGADLLALASLLLAVAGLMLRLRIASWTALFALLSSAADTNTSELDVKALLVCGTLSVAGLLINTFLG